MPIWLLLSIIGIGAYMFGQSAAQAAAAATPQLPIKTLTVGTNGADYYADLTTSSSSSYGGASPSTVGSSSGTASIIGTTVLGQIPAGTVLTPIDSAQITAQSSVFPSSSGGFSQSSQSQGTTSIPVFKANYNGQMVWVNRNEVY
jgi:hypothetical protein